MSSTIRAHAVLLLSMVTAWGQISTGTIVGAVEDSTGAVVPNADITIVQASTKESRPTRSNASGEFNVPFLQVGDYSVTVSAPRPRSTGVERRCTIACTEAAKVTGRAWRRDM